ncbi:MAG: TetR/AcrR family transcriptional regulator [Micropepsaceae bacterium]
MAALPKHRGRIVRTAAMLFRRNGYAATGTNEIVAVSGAPKGSLYHYFPGGKAEIAAEAVTYAGGVVTATLKALTAEHPAAAAAIRAYGVLLAGWFARSGYREGCPIATTILELAPATAAVTAAGRQVYEDWVAIFAAALVRDGVADARAAALARTAIAAFQGALILARTAQNDTAIAETTAEIANLFESVSRSGR